MRFLPKMAHNARCWRTFYFVSILVQLYSFLPAQDGVEMVQLTLESGPQLKPPEFPVIPDNVRLAPSDWPSPKVIVPRSIENVARNASVKIGHMRKALVLGTPELVTDGDKGPRFLELDRGVQWIEIDLGSPCEVYGIGIWLFPDNALRVFRDVSVRASADVSFNRSVTVLFNNDHDNSASLGKGGDFEYYERKEGLLVDGRKERVRFIRVYSNGSTTDDMNRFTEVEVWGLRLGANVKEKEPSSSPPPRPVPPPPPARAGG